MNKTVKILAIASFFVILLARISSFSKNLQKKRKPLKFVLPNKKIKGIRLCMNKFYL